MRLKFRIQESLDFPSPRITAMLLPRCQGGKLRAHVSPSKWLRQQATGMRFDRLADPLNRNDIPVSRGAPSYWYKRAVTQNPIVLC